MLGNTEETEFRSSREEDVDPEQQQEILEESKENLLNSDVHCADVSALETSDENHLPKTHIPVEEGIIEGDDIRKDLILEPVIESKAVIVSSSELQENVTNPEKSLPETAVSEERGLNETSYPDSEETQIRSSAEGRNSDFTERSNKRSEKQDKKFEDTEGTDLMSTETCHQQTAACVMKEGPIEESVTVLSNTEPQQEPENAEEAENDAAEGTPSSSNKGKKRKKKKKGKKKGAAQNDTQNQQTSETEKGSQITVKHVESGEMNECIVESHVDTLVTGNLTESVKNDQGIQQHENTGPVEAPQSSLQEKSLKETQAECEKEQKEEGTKTEEVEAAPPPETLIDTNAHNDTDEQKKGQAKEAPIVESAEAVTLSDSCPLVETHDELRTDSEKSNKDDELGLETDKLEAVTSVDLKASPCSYDSSSWSDESLNRVATCVDSIDKADPVPTNTNFINADSKAEDQLKEKFDPVEETTTECTTNNSPETSSEENTKLESFVSTGNDVSAPESESMNVSSPSTTDAFRRFSESETSAAMNSDIDPSINVLEQRTEEATEEVTISEAPAEEMEEESAASPGQDSMLEQDVRERKELDEGVTEPGESEKPHSSSSDERSESCHGTPVTKPPTAVDTETGVQNEQLEESEDKTPQHAEQNDETVAEEKREEDQTLDSLEEASKAEVGSSIKQETEDPERENSQHDESEELHESVQARSENMEPSPPTQLYSDEEDEEDEGQSFDFDDLDVEAAVAHEVPHNPEEEEFEEGVEAMSDESSDGKSGSCQSETQQDKPAETNEKTHATDGPNQTVSEEANPEEKQNPLAHGESTSGKDENRLQEGEPGAAEEEKSELGAFVENIKEKMSSLEEALLVKLDLQNEAPASSKSTDQVAESKEPAQAGKDVRKGNKKGKGKGKEECKVS